MKSDNIFRFVAIRPASFRASIHLPGDDDAKQRIREAFDQMEQDLIPHMEARRRVGEKFARSAGYVFAGSRGRPLVESASTLRELLRAHATNPDPPGFRAALARLLGSAFPAPIGEFVSSEQYRVFKQSLWLGYYALVLSPKERPSDREVAALWIRACHLAESPDAESFARRARTILRIRPAVPFAWVVKGTPLVPRKRTGDKQPPGARLETLIRALAEARSALHDLLLAKLRHRESAPERRKSNEVFGITGDLDLASPWGLTPAEIEHHRRHLRKAAEVSINHELMPLPELVNEMDVRIAQLTADLHALRRRPRLLMNGGTFVRVQS